MAKTNCTQDNPTGIADTCYRCQNLWVLSIGGHFWQECRRCGADTTGQLCGYRPNAPPLVFLPGLYYPVCAALQRGA